MPPPPRVWARWAVAAAGLGLHPLCALGVGPEHWCAGRGAFSVNGTRCPPDDSSGPCPPGCDAYEQDCGNSCDPWASTVAIIASVLVVLVFVGGVVVPVVWGGYHMPSADFIEEVDDAPKSPLSPRYWANPMTDSVDSVADGSDDAGGLEHVDGNGVAAFLKTLEKQ